MTWLFVLALVLAAAFFGAGIALLTVIGLERRALERRWRKAKRIAVLIDAADKIERLAA